MLDSPARSRVKVQIEGLTVFNPLSDWTRTLLAIEWRYDVQKLFMIKVTVTDRMAPSSLLVAQSGMIGMNRTGPSSSDIITPYSFRMEFRRLRAHTSSHHLAWCRMSYPSDTVHDEYICQYLFIMQRNKLSTKLQPRSFWHLHCATTSLRTHEACRASTTHWEVGLQHRVNFGSSHYDYTEERHAVTFSKPSLSPVFLFYGRSEDI